MLLRLKESIVHSSARSKVRILCLKAIGKYNLIIPIKAVLAIDNEATPS